MNQIDKSSLSTRLENYLYNNSNSNSKVRGYQLIAQNKVSLGQSNPDHNEFTFKVKSQRDTSIYDVIIRIIGRKVWNYCNCPYSYGGLCKHEVAALTLLRQKLIAGTLSSHIKQADANFNFSYLSLELLNEWASNHPGVQNVENIDLLHSLIILKNK